MKTLKVEELKLKPKVKAGSKSIGFKEQKPLKFKGKQGKAKGLKNCLKVIMNFNFQI